jgi:thiol-disulfide isomerase/thioredoxin
MKRILLYCILTFALFSKRAKAQNTKINWITFEQLEDSLKTNPKKVFISFHADWCVFCKKMDKVAFQDDEVITELNTNYYAVKMNAESKEVIIFDGKKYSNQYIGKSRKPTHDIPLLLASRKAKPFSLPANLVLDKNFIIKERSFEYLSPKALLSMLTKR